MTQQLMDSIIVGNERLHLRVSRPLPKNENLFFKRDMKEVNDIYTSTMCGLGYVAQYLESNGLIYLIDIDGVIGLKGKEPTRAWWIDGEIETDCSLVFVVRNGRITDRYVRPIELTTPKYTTKERLLQLASGLLPKRQEHTEKTKLTARRIELLRYRKALLEIRVEKYLSGSKRYSFATSRLRKTKRMIERLKASQSTS